MPEVVQSDVLIVGGGPAGLATAIAAARRGRHVTVIDRAGPLIDKACGEGLTPEAIGVLSQLGVRIPDERSAPFHGVRFLGQGRVAEARFRRGAGVGIRRTVLHPLLSESAAAAGVELLWNTPIRDFQPGRVFTPTAEIRYRYLIGADGHDSAVRRAAGLEASSRNGVRYGFRRHYPVAPWSDCVEVYWAPGCQVYITPVDAAHVCVALLSRRQDLRLDAILPLFPALQHRFIGAMPSPERGAVTASRRLRRVTVDRVALVGDASGSVDAITGEGLSLTFLQALSLAEAIASDDLSLYARSHARLFRRPAFMAGLMLLLDPSPFLQRRVISALEQNPRIFSELLALHVGQVPAPAAARLILSLGWNLLTAH